MGYRKTTVILGIFSCWLNLVAQSIERTTVEANLVTEEGKALLNLIAKEENKHMTALSSLSD